MIAADESADPSSRRREGLWHDLPRNAAIMVGRRLFLAAVLFGLLLLQVWSNGTGVMTTQR